MATPTYTAIASITLGSSASSVTFSSIPQDYRDLVLVVNGGSSNPATGFEIQPNGSAADASMVRASGNGSTTSSSTTSPSFGVLTDSTSMFIVQVMDYSATDKHKTFLIKSRNLTADGAEMSAAKWGQTSAITSLVVGDTGAATLDSGSTFALYGIEA